METLGDLFTHRYGHGLALSKLSLSLTGINFVSRTSKNNGIAARVERLEDVEPIESGAITVTLSGSVLEAFVQPEEFYTAYHIFCLFPRERMTIQEKLFYCLCIRENQYRYNYGRQANRTLMELKVPSPNEIPSWVNNNGIKDNLSNSIDDYVFDPFYNEVTSISEDIFSEDMIRVEDLFEVIYGSNLALNKLTKDPRGINFVSRTSKNNGVSAKVKRIPDLDPISPPVLSVAAGGSVLETFLQLEPFYSGRDLYYLRPRISLSNLELMYYASCIKANKYRYNYGRQANKTLSEILIPSPKNIPSWVTEESIITDLESKIKNILVE